MDTERFQQSLQHHVVCTQKKASAYNNKSKRCHLCLAEKLAIMRADKASSLNKRSEQVSKCRHEEKYYLSNFVEDIPCVI